LPGHKDGKVCSSKQNVENNEINVSAVSFSATATVMLNVTYSVHCGSFSTLFFSYFSNILEQRK